MYYGLKLEQYIFRNGESLRVSVEKHSLPALIYIIQVHIIDLPN